MSKTGYKNPKQWGLEMWTYFTTRYRHDILVNSRKIIDRRIYLSNYTDASTSYTEFIRKFALSFSLVVLRNDHNIQEGIVVIGEEFLVNAFEKLFEKAMESIENNTTISKKVFYSRDTSPEAYQSYRTETIKKFENHLYLGKKRDALLNDAWPDDFEKITATEVYNHIRYKDYRKEIPALRVLKEFYYKPETPE